jgi:murein DD-endopeptidase MepM/ murein hydrolase activator NlpD
MGSTGLSTGSHPHFEVRDPLTFLSQAALKPAVW